MVRVASQWVDQKGLIRWIVQETVYPWIYQACT